jgi:hypothetical protein
MGQVRSDISGGPACAACDTALALAGPDWELVPAGHTTASWSGHISGHLTRNEIPLSLLRLVLRRHYLDDGAAMWAEPGSQKRRLGSTATTHLGCARPCANT